MDMRDSEIERIRAINSVIERDPFVIVRSSERSWFAFECNSKYELHPIPDVKSDNREDEIVERIHVHSNESYRATAPLPILTLEMVFYPTPHHRSYDVCIHYQLANFHHGC